MLDLTPAQIATLEKLAAAGFDLVSLPHVERYLAVEKNGFVALLEPAQGQFRIFGQVGLRIGEGMGMLVEQQGSKVFVWHEQRVEATSELVERYEHFRLELRSLLEMKS